MPKRASRPRATGRVAERIARGKEKFLAAYGRTGFVCFAAKAAGVGRRTVYDWRAADEVFAEAWDKADEEATSVLEDEATRRAMNGSDTLLIFMLKAKKPEKYREKFQHEHGGKGGGAIPFVGTVIDPEQLTKLSDKELNALRGIVSKVGAAPADAGSDPGGAGTPRS